MSAALEAQARRERQEALRALLARPLLSSAGADAAAFALVRRHAAALREWLARFPRWTLSIDAEQARLRKTPGDTGDATRPARDPEKESPFTRRRYVLLCLALAALEGEDRQTTLGRLAERIMALFAADPALGRAGDFDLESQDERRDLVHVVRLLISLRVLVRVAGEEQGFIHDRGKDALYNVSRPALAAVPCFRRAPSTVEAVGTAARIAAIVEEPAPETEEARHQALRTRLVRRLLDDPIVYYADLSPEEAASLTRQRGLLLKEIEAATGLVGEVRREGIAMVDPEGELTDVAMPEEGTDGHVTLLVAEWLADCARHGRAVGAAAVEQRVAELVAEHRARWRRGVTEPGAEVVLAEQAIERLAALRLVRRARDGRIDPRAAIARYAIGAPTSTTPRRRRAGDAAAGASP
ncbi:MAG: TIGR02678 family protein [Polyangiaceae bacterium]|nr:TIGR02678 family protein [Polyangiaceae bacterium]